MDRISLNTMIIIIVLLLIGVLCFLVVILKNRQEAKTEELEEKVKQYSRQYLALCKLNNDKTLAFSRIKSPMTLVIPLESKTKFDRYDIREAFLSYLNVEEKTHTLEEMLQSAERNKNISVQYEKSVVTIKSLPLLTEEECKALGISYKKASQYENKLITSVIRSKPVTNVTVIWKITYDSPAGRNHYERSYAFGSSEIISCIREAKNRKASDAEKEASQYYQRRLVTPGLRYDVMKRDGFRCVLCGRSAEDGVLLHVDHIIPVSKGGRTIMENLQTLCSECNLGKSDKLD